MRIDRLVIAVKDLPSDGAAVAPEPALARLRDEFPSVWIRTGRPAAGETLVAVELPWWVDPTVDPERLDARLGAAEGTGVSGVFLDGRALPLSDVLPAAEQLLTRCQRLIEGRNRHSGGAQFAAVLRRHPRLFDRARPLGRAALDHALDAWQWTMRLDPEAGFEVQVAALFHGIGEGGGGAPSAEALERVLFELGTDRATRERIAALARSRGTARCADRDQALLADACALAAFSLGSSGWIERDGVEGARARVRAELARLSSGGRARLRRLRLRRDVEAVLADVESSARGAA